MPERYDVIVTSDVEIDTSTESELNKDDPVERETITGFDGDHGENGYAYVVSVMAPDGAGVGPAKVRLESAGFEVQETNDPERPLHVTGVGQK
ncbi:MAG: hypothetical protein Q4F53_07910 [Nesterenkonia sp.]|uniref:hypothetical protein n=1 Tax=Nesterenkonia marinintestina TaxID=2979865 RepID=UPI0021BF562D|nr:hypothetical protein [Nesterenkonia sp. GX14115]MDO5493517.1 hypothetical protein [Nesterenkonia sp.]